MMLNRSVCASRHPAAFACLPGRAFQHFALLGLSAMLVGCATSASPLPQADPAFATISTRFQHHELGGARWQSFSIAYVDGKYQMFSSDGGSADLKVLPGERRLSIRSAFHGWPTVAEVHGRHDAKMELLVNVEGGRVYRLTGEPRGARHFVWLEDAVTKRRVSSEASAAYAPHRLEFYYIPIGR